MKALLIIFNLNGGAPTIVDFPTIDDCVGAKIEIAAQAQVGNGRSTIRLACVLYPK